MRLDQLDVLEFHKAFDVKTPDKPTLEGYPFKLRIALILEELVEFAEASGFDLMLDTRQGSRYDANKSTTQAETIIQNGDEASQADMIDALADLIYVVHGAAIAMGIDLEPFYAEVQRSNMAKLGPDGKPVRRASDSKILKPEGWTPPDIEGLLDKTPERFCHLCGSNYCNGGCDDENVAQAVLD